jgi:hypothetical protein
MVLPDLFPGRRRGRLAEINTRAAYGTYVVQPLVLVAIAVLLRETGLPLRVKFLALVSPTSRCASRRRPR